MGRMSLQCNTRKSASKIITNKKEWIATLCFFFLHCRLTTDSDCAFHIDEGALISNLIQKKSNQLQCFDNDPFTIASYQLLLCTEEEKKCNTNLDYPPILPQSHL